MHVVAVLHCAFEFTVSIFDNLIFFSEYPANYAAISWPSRSINVHWLIHIHAGECFVQLAVSWLCVESEICSGLRMRLSVI